MLIRYEQFLGLVQLSIIGSLDFQNLSSTMTKRQRRSDERASTEYEFRLRLDLIPQLVNFSHSSSRSSGCAALKGAHGGILTDRKIRLHSAESV